MQFEGDGRTEQQGMGLLKPPWVGGSTALPGRGKVTTCWHEWGHSMSLPGLLETIPSIYAFHSVLLLAQLRLLSLNPWEKPSNPGLKYSHLLPTQAAYHKSTGFSLKTHCRSAGLEGRIRPQALSTSLG